MEERSGLSKYISIFDMRKVQNTKGFVALISVLVISTILFASVALLAQSHIVHRYMLLDFENKLQSEQLAAACVHIGKLFIYNNPYITTDTLPYGGVFPIQDTTCSVLSIVTKGLKKEITTQGTFKTSVTTLYAEVDMNSNDITLWQEIPHL